MREVPEPVPLHMGEGRVHPLNESPAHCRALGEYFGGVQYLVKRYLSGDVQVFWHIPLLAEHLACFVFIGT